MEESRPEGEKETLQAEEEKPRSEEVKPVPAAEPAPADDQQGVYNGKEDEKPKNFHFQPPSGKVDGIHRKLADQIDEDRKNFVKNYRSAKFGSTVSISVFMVLAIASFIIYFLLANSENQALFNGLLWPFVALSAIAFGVYLFFSFAGKKKTTADIMEYLTSWTDSFVSDIYLGKPGVENVSFAVDGKVDDWAVIRSHYFATINSIDSRSRVVMDFLGKAYSDTEVSIAVPPYSEFVQRIASEKVVADPDAEPAPQEALTDDEEEPKKKKKVVSDTRMPYVGGYGKFLTFDAKLPSPSDVLIVVRKAEDTYLPTNVHGLVRRDDLAHSLLGEDFLVYANRPAVATAVLTPEVVQNLLSLSLGKILLDWFFSITKDGACFMLNYSPVVMEIPMYDKRTEDELEKYPSDVSHAMKVFALLHEDEGSYPPEEKIPEVKVDDVVVDGKEEPENSSKEGEESTSNLSSEETQPSETSSDRQSAGDTSENA